MDSDEVAVGLWFFLAEADEKCWNCNELSRVFAILLPESDTFDVAPCVLTNISSLNTEVERYLREVAPNFFHDHSSTAGMGYWMNHCDKCSAKFGDHYLHSSPGHAFFPVSKEEVARIRINRVDTRIQAEAGWGQSSWIDDLLGNE